MRELGALYLAGSDEAAVALKQEYKDLIEFGAKVEWWDEARVAKEKSCPAGTKAGIFLEKDAIINSQQYSKELIKLASENEHVEVWEECPEMVKVLDEKKHATVFLKDGTKLTCDHVIMATGGLYVDKNLAGILRPCWSYLVSVPHPERETQIIKENTVFSDGSAAYSYNMYTWGFTHDWCWTNGVIRCSGEDHYSALKAPRAEARCKSLANWVHASYPSAFGKIKVDELKYQTAYGVYSETPDSLPVIGHLNSNSRICYLVGCNAWGQASLSYAATLVPGLLGLSPFSSKQKEFLALITIRRFGVAQP